jgi:hypothetical protein
LCLTVPLPTLISTCTTGMPQLKTAKRSSKARRRQGKCVVKSEMCRSGSLKAASVNSKRHTALCTNSIYPCYSSPFWFSLFSRASSLFTPPPPLHLSSYIFYILIYIIFLLIPLQSQTPFIFPILLLSFSPFLPFPNSPVPLTYSATCHVQHNELWLTCYSHIATSQLAHNLLTYSMEQSPSWEANWFCS